MCVFLRGASQSSCPQVQIFLLDVVAGELLAEAGWRTAQENLQLVTAKVERGEAGELDLISGQLAVLRSERELESAQLAAARALENLLAAVDLAGPYDLEPLEASSLPHSGIEPDLAALLADTAAALPAWLTPSAELLQARLQQDDAGGQS